MVAAEHHPYLAYFALYLSWVFSFKIKVKRNFKIILYIYLRGLFFILTLILISMERRIYIMEGESGKPILILEIAKGSLELYLVNKGLDEEGEEYLKQAVNS